MSTIYNATKYNATKPAQRMRLEIATLVLIVGIATLALLAFAIFEAHGVVVHHAIAPTIGKIVRPLSECGGGVGTPC